LLGALSGTSKCGILIKPGKPTQNAYVESFHGKLREERLPVSWNTNLFDARRKVADWGRSTTWNGHTAVSTT
jgi:transposase InsO family protein